MLEVAAWCAVLQPVTRKRDDDRAAAADQNAKADEWAGGAASELRRQRSESSRGRESRLRKKG